VLFYILDVSVVSLQEFEELNLLEKALDSAKRTRNMYQKKVRMVKKCFLFARICGSSWVFFTVLFITVMHISQVV